MRLRDDESERQGMRRELSKFYSEDEFLRGPSTFTLYIQPTLKQGIIMSSR